MDEKVFYIVVLLLIALGLAVAVYVAPSKTLNYEADHVVVETINTQVFNYNVTNNASGMTLFVSGIVVALVGAFAIVERSSRKMLVAPAVIVYIAAVGLITPSVTVFTGTFKGQKIDCVSDVCEYSGTVVRWTQWLLLNQPITLLLLQWEL